MAGFRLVPGARVCDSAHVTAVEGEVSGHIVWWIMAAILVGVELATGTFYLLAVGAAFAVGGIAAWLGAESWLQFAIATVATVVGVMMAHRLRRRIAQPAPMGGLDVGQMVRVLEWRDDGTARVQYRGSYWDGRAESPDTPRQEHMQISAMQGSVLVLSEPRQ